MTDTRTVLCGVVLEDEPTTLTTTDLCRACGVHAEVIIEYVEYGILEPQGRGVRAWRFSPGNLRRAQRALNLQRDLDINAAGIALALDLLDEVASLRARLAALQPR